MTAVPTRPRPPTDDVGDAVLLRTSLDEPKQFDAFFTRHVGAIFAFACARVGPEHAEDVTAETFAAAFQARASFDPDAPSARPWLYGIATNKLRRHHQLERLWLERIRLEPVSPDTDEQAASDARIDVERIAPFLQAALADLTVGERDVLLLHVLGELTHQQIAVALGIRRGTAKSRLSRGRARLQSALPPQFGASFDDRGSDDD